MRYFGQSRAAFASLIAGLSIGASGFAQEAAPARERSRPAASSDEARASAPLDVRTLLGTLSADADVLVSVDIDALLEMLGSSSPAPAAIGAAETALRAIVSQRQRDFGAYTVDFSRIEQVAIGADWGAESIFMTTSPSIANVAFIDQGSPEPVVGSALGALRSPYLHIGTREGFAELLDGTEARFAPDSWWPSAWQQVSTDAVAIVVFSGSEWFADAPPDVRGMIGAIEPRRVLAWIDRDGSMHARIDAAAPSTLLGALGGVQAGIAALIDGERPAMSAGVAALADVARLAVDAIFSRVTVSSEGSLVSFDLAPPQCGGLAQQLGAASLITAMAAVAHESGYNPIAGFETPVVELASDCSLPDISATLDTTALRVVGGGPAWRGLYATMDLDAVLLRSASTFGGLLPFALDPAAVAEALAPLGLDALDVDVTAYVEEMAGGPGAWYVSIPAAAARLLPAIARRTLVEVDDLAVAGDSEVLERSAPPTLPAGWERAFSLASVDSPVALVISGSNVQRAWQSVANHVPRSDFGDILTGAQALSLSLDAEGRPVAYLVGNYTVDPAAATTSLRTLITRSIETLAAISGTTSPTDLDVVRAAAESFASTLTIRAVGDDALALTVDADGHAVVGTWVGALVGLSPLLPRLERQIAIDEAHSSLYEIHGSLANLVYNARYPATGPGRPATSGTPVIVFPPSVSATPGVTALEAACDESEGWITYDPERWSDPTWQELDFAPPEQHRFVYEFDSSKINAQPAFTARAIGDLDCDGVYSTYRIFGVVDPGGWLNGGWIESELPGE